MRYAALSDTGRVRLNNEDSYHADGRVFIVADGMGGHRAGEVASAVAIEEFLRYERERRGEEPLQRLRGGISAANRALYGMVRGDPVLEGMGTTFTAALVEGGVYLGHVGDSRAYLWRGGELRVLTSDHTLVERMVREGFISPGEALVHPQRNIILRALGVSEKLEVDLRSLDVLAGDRLLLCSDGLTGSLGDAELQSIISRYGDVEERCRRLVDAANQRGGMDNITVIMVDFEGDPGATPPAGGGGKRARRRRLFRRGLS